MTIVTLDSNDTAGILADAGITLDQPEAKPAVEVAKPEVKPVDKAADPVKPSEEDEDENGLTAEQKRVLTKTMQQAIGRKTAKLRAAEEFAEAQYNERTLAQQRADRLERENTELKAKLTPKPEPKAEATPPQRENFANEAAYVDAMIDYGIEKRLAEKAEEDRVASDKRKFDERMATATGRIKKAIELVPDFEDVVNGAVGETQLSPAIGTYLEESEMVAELTYYLAQNPDVLVSLLKLSPHSQLVKIGKIESTLTPFEPRKAAQHDDKSSDDTSNGKPLKAEPSVDTGIDLSKPRSKPAPVFTPLEGSGSAGASKDSKDMNIRESIEDFAKRNRTNLNARKRH
jgi:hypothetical protein